MAICFLERGTAEAVRKAINSDPEFKLASKFFSKDFLLVVGDSRCIIKVRDGLVTELVLDPNPLDPWSFMIKGSLASWEKFLLPAPPPFHNGLYPAMVRQILELGGDLESAFAHFWPVARLLDLMRELQNR